MCGMRISAAVLVCALGALAVPASAEWTVTKWSGDGNQWRAVELSQEILIEGPGTYKFVVTDDGQPADLLGLTVLPSAGNVTVYLETETGGPGCLNLGAVSYGANSELTLAEVRVAASAATAGDINVSTLTGQLLVEQDVVHSIEIGEVLLGAPIHCRALAGLRVLSSESRGALRAGSITSEGVEFAGDLDYLLIGDDIRAPVTIGGSVGSVALAQQEGEERQVINVEAPVEIGGSIDVLAAYIIAFAPVYFGGPVGAADFNADIRTQVTFAGDILLSSTNVWYVGISADAALDVQGGLGSAFYLDQCWCQVNGRWSIAGDVEGTLRFVALETNGLLQIGSLSGTIDFGRTINGSVEIAGDLSGQLTLEGRGGPSASLDGQVRVGGDLTGEIRVGTPAQNEDFRGNVTIYGDVDGGAILVCGDMRPEDPNDPNSPSPYIRIDGGFGPDGSAPSMIDIDGVFEGEDRFITIDFDGYHEDDRWDPNSRIWIGAGPPYAGNNPDVRLYEITGCKGDMDNNGDVDYYDIDPLILAFDPEAYESAYAGIAGARVFHGDLNCDSVVNFYDIDPFVARIGHPCSDACGYPPEGGCGGGQMQMMGGGAAAIAAQLAASVPAENMPALIASIEHLALDPPPSSAVDWSAVLAALAGM